MSFRTPHDSNRKADHKNPFQGDGARSDKTTCFSNSKDRSAPAAKDANHPGENVAQTAAEVPQKVQDRYDFVAEVGRGGRGVVNHVFDSQLQREVAVKRLLPDANVTDKEREQFLHEARVTSQLQHPGIVPVHELGAAEQGSAYYVMKLMSGDTFRQQIRSAHGDASSSPTRKDLIRLIAPLLDRFVDVCNAVAYAHQKGVVHRDLKPANIMSGAFAETLVLDWGLAVDTTTYVISESDVGLVAGTPAYMSPEQAGGKVESISPPSDVFSLGVILYEIITGRHPHKGLPIDEILDRVQSGTRPVLSTLQPSTPAALISIVEKAMALDPRERYASAEAIAKDVRRFVSGESVSTHRESIVDRAVRWCQHHRQLAATLAVSTILMLAGTTAFAMIIQRAHRLERIARIEAQAAHRDAVQHLREARKATDDWLVELRGAIEFDTNSKPLHQKLLQQAIVHYQRLDETYRQEAKDISDFSAPVNTIAGIEHARCNLRLGDLFWLTDQQTKSQASYQNADVVLARLTNQQPQIQQVSFVGDTGGLKESVELEKVKLFVGKLQASRHCHWPELSKMRSWLQDRMPDTTTQQRSGLLRCGEYELDVARTAVRLELSVAHSDHNSNSHDTQIHNLDELAQAVQWARWAFGATGSTGDHQLTQSALYALARGLGIGKQHDREARVWSELIEEIKLRHHDQLDQPTVVQSLARLRLHQASAMLQAGQFRKAVQEFGDATKMLQQAWNLTELEFVIQSGRKND